MHLRFKAETGAVHYEPIETVEIEIRDRGWINGRMVSPATADSAVRALERQASLPALGVWDCELEDGGTAP